MTDDGNLKNADKDKTRGDSYLTPMDVKNLNNGTVLSDENSFWENNPSSEPQCSKRVKVGVMAEETERLSENQHDCLDENNFPAVLQSDEVTNDMEHDRMKVDNINTDHLDDEKI